MFNSIDQIKSKNQAIGHHWFESGSMRFFNSRIGQTVYYGHFFVSSEQFHGSNGVTYPREFSIRYAKSTGEVNTVGEYHGYKTRYQAIAAIKRNHEKWIKERTTS